jgi:hypothetical protein
MYVKPAPGLVIRDPDMLDYLPEAGRAVPETDYWHRRVRDGDVVAAQPPVEDPAKAVAQVIETNISTGE